MWAVMGNNLYTDDDLIVPWEPHATNYVLAPLTRARLQVWEDQLRS